MSLFDALKSLTRQALPPRLVSLLRAGARRLHRARFFLTLCVDHFRDARRFHRWSHTGRGDRTQAQQESAITKFYHGFEKGLSLQEPRPGFGQDKARMLMGKVEEYERCFPPTDLTCSARAALASYAEFNRDHGVVLPWLETWLAAGPDDRRGGQGGTIAISREEIAKAVSGTTEEFFLSRHSVRNFGPGEVSLEDIERAVRIAQKSPSVCNRQGVRLYCAPNAMDALHWQPGNRGFGHLASRGLVVTADLQAFSSEGERHQAYVDGGLFAMSLVLGLHAMGYGTCMLAWSKRPVEEAGLRGAFDIPDNEVIIMMIAVGRLPENLEVACSQRRPLTEVLRMHS